MKVGIVGSRRRTDKQSVIDFVNSLPPDSIIVSGGCRGVDTWAEEAAIARDMKVIVFLPRIHNGMQYYEMVKAYYARNKLIAEQCDYLVAYVAPDRTGGTENTIKYTRQLNKVVEIR